MSRDDSMVVRELFVRSFFQARPPDRVTNQFVASMRDVELTAGTEVFRAGDPPDQLFFVVTGRVRLEAPGEKPWILQDESVIGILDAGMRRPHKRTAVAETDVRAIVMDFDDYVEILEDNFEFSKNVMIQVMGVVHELSLQLSPDRVFPATDEQKALIKEEIVQAGRPLNQIERLMVLHDSRYFQGAPIQALVTLAKQAKEEKWAPGDVLFRPGDPCDEIRIVAQGTVRVRRDEPAIEAPFAPGGLILAAAAIGCDTYEYEGVAPTEATTLALAKEEIYDVMEDHFGLAITMFGFVARENERVRGQLVAEGKRPQEPSRNLPAAAGQA